MRHSKKIYWDIFLNHLAYSLFYVLITQVVYHQFLSKANLKGYWVGIPLLLYVLSLYIGKLMVKKELSPRFLGIVCLLSLILSFLFLKMERIEAWIFEHLDVVTFITIAIFFLNIIVRKKNNWDRNLEGLDKPKKELFNLFYINTSKVHEIAMLIDNKIMKTIEREQVSEELLKYKNTINVGSKGNWNADLGYSKDESTKKKVYESFDVKITKSIMLQRIYENIKKSKSRNGNQV